MFIGDLVLIAFLSLHAYRDGTSILYTGERKQEIIQLTIAQWIRSTISKSLSSAVLQTPLLMMNKNVYSFDAAAAPHTTTQIPSLPVHGLWPRKAVFCSLGNLIVQCQYIPGPKFSVYTIYCVVSLWLVLPMMYYDCGLSSTDM